MEIQALLDFVVQQGIWCSLFVWLFYNSREDNKRIFDESKLEALKREERLLNIIDEHSKSLIDITQTLEAIQEDLKRNGQ